MTETDLGGNLAATPRKTGDCVTLKRHQWANFSMSAKIIRVIVDSPDALFLVEVRVSNRPVTYIADEQEILTTR